MTMAAEYRQYAQECIQSAKTATDPIRKQFLDLAKLWMMAADKLDSGGAVPDVEPGQFGADGKSPPKPTGGAPDEPR